MHFLSHGRCCRVRQVSLSLNLGWHKPLHLLPGNYPKIITVRCETVVHFLGKWCWLSAAHTHTCTHTRMHACTLKAPVNLFSLKPPGFTLTGLAELGLASCPPAQTPRRKEPGVCYWPCFCHPPINFHRGRNEFWFGDAGMVEIST